MRRRVHVGLKTSVLPVRCQLEICREQVEWARTEKRTFLRQRIEARLANLLLQMGDYSGALALIGKLLTEVRRLSIRGHIPVFRFVRG